MMRLFFAAALLLLTACGHLAVIDPAKDPLSPGERVKLAAIYESKGEYDLAIKEYDSVIALDAKNEHAYFGKANVLFNKKDIDGAEKNYLKAIELDPENGAYYNNLAHIYIEKADFERAEETIKEAVRFEHDKGYFIYLDTLGVIQMMQGKHQEAEVSFRQSVETGAELKDPGVVNVLRHMLDLYLQTGQLDKAEYLMGVLSRIEKAGSGEGQ